MVSCAVVAPVQGRVRNLAVRGEFEEASRFFSRSDFGSYGRNNRLLEALDRGLIFHYAGDYPASIEAFERAKRIYDELYTRSLSGIAASWLWNDATLPYPGEDFERALMNVFQSLNFLALDDAQGALIEARNAISVLQTINDRYAPGQKNVYADDAFVRMFMGMIYELFGERQEMNDAFLSYTKAAEIYQEVYQGNYHLEIPDILKERLLSAARWMGAQEFQSYRKRFPESQASDWTDEGDRAIVILVMYRGQIVNKVPSSILLPGMDGFLTRVSFPRYRKALRTKFSDSVLVRGTGGFEQKIALAQVEDLDAIARQNLDNRRTRILARAIARPVGKQLILEALEDGVRDKAGETAGDLMNYAGNLYLLYSEQADLRGWETLPSEILIGQFQLSAGDYTMWVRDQKITDISLESGQKKFMMCWVCY